MGRGSQTTAADVLYGNTGVRHPSIIEDTSSSIFALTVNVRFRDRSDCQYWVVTDADGKVLADSEDAEEAIVKARMIVQNSNSDEAAITSHRLNRRGIVLIYDTHDILIDSQPVSIK